MTFAILVLAGLSLFYVDATLAQFLFTDPYNIRAIAKVLTELGEGWPYFAICGGGAALLFILQRVSQPKEAPRSWILWYYRFLFGFVCLCVSGIMVTAIKQLVGRQRPYVSEGRDAMVFDPFNPHWDHHSLPSGHAQVFFTVAGILSVLFPRWTVGWMCLAGLLSLTRPIIGAHFLSDIMVGGLVGVTGVTISRLIWWKFQQRHRVQVLSRRY